MFFTLCSYFLNSKECFLIFADSLHILFSLSWVFTSFCSIHLQSTAAALILQAFITSLRCRFQMLYIFLTWTNVKFCPHLRPWFLCMYGWTKEVLSVLSTLSAGWVLKNEHLKCQVTKLWTQKSSVFSLPLNEWVARRKVGKNRGHRSHSLSLFCLISIYSVISPIAEFNNRGEWENVRGISMLIK